MSLSGRDVIDVGQLALLLELPSLDPLAVDRIAAQAPSGLRGIAHYAALWGVSDDGCRSDLIRRSSIELRRNLTLVVKAHEEWLEEWLAGPEAAGPDFTDAYIAYSALLMAADEA